MGFKRGAIHLVKFDPVKGVEPGKIRPAVIFQDQELLDINYKTVIVIPLTSNLCGCYPLRVRITKRGNLRKDSDAMVDQIRAVDRSRIYPEVLAELSSEELEKLGEALKIVTGIGLL